MRRAGNRLRITAQLTSVRDGRTLWSERYDRELADVFAIQDEIARTIVDTLRATLLQDLGDPTPVRYTANLRAYNLYLKGRYCVEPADAGGDRRGDPVLRGRHRGGRRTTRWRTPGWPIPTRCSSTTAARRCRRGSSAPGPRRSGRSRSTRPWRRPTPRSAWVTFIYDWDWPLAAPAFPPGASSSIRATPWPGSGTPGSRSRWGSSTRRWPRGGRRSRSIPRRSRSAGAWAGCTTTPASPSRRSSSSAAPLAMNPTAEENHRLLGLAYVQRGTVGRGGRGVPRGDRHLGEPGARPRRTGRGGRGAGPAGRGPRGPGRAGGAARTRYVTPVAFVMLHTALGEPDPAFAWLDRAYERAARLAGVPQRGADARRSARRSAVPAAAGAHAADVRAGRRGRV